MTIYKLVALACAGAVFIFGAQKREASKEVRSKLFKQVMADITDLRECVEQEEGGARVAVVGNVARACVNRVA